MRILITGGAGYIASHIILDLLYSSENYEILAIDDLSTGSVENILEKQKNYRFEKADFASSKGIQAITSFQPEVTIHFAALKAAGISMTDPESYSKSNLRKSFLLIEELSKVNCKYFIFSSSAAVYGEPQHLTINEEHPKNPINYYGFTKLIIEENLKWFSRLGKFNFAILRYFNAAGYDIKNRVKGLEKEANNLIPIIMEVAIGKRKQLQIYGSDYSTPDGTCIRDYIHVSDLSKAHILAMKYITQKKENLTLNLGTEKGYSVKEVLSTSINVCQKEIPHHYTSRREGDSAQLVSSAKLAYEILNWKPKHSDIQTIVSTSWKAYEKYFSQD